MTPFPRSMLGVGHDKPDTKAQFAFGDLSRGVLAYLVLTAGAVIGRDLYQDG